MNIMVKKYCCNECSTTCRIEVSLKRGHQEPERCIYSAFLESNWKLISEDVMKKSECRECLAYKTEDSKVLCINCSENPNLVNHFVSVRYKSHFERWLESRYGSADYFNKTAMKECWDSSRDELWGTNEKNIENIKKEMNIK